MLRLQSKMLRKLEFHLKPTVKHTPIFNTLLYKMEEFHIIFRRYSTSTDFSGLVSCRDLLACLTSQTLDFESTYW